MRKVVAMGETILDILFRGGQPVAAVPGGSSFNSMVSVGRTGWPAAFLGYTGGDEVGRQIVAFMRRNGIATDYCEQREGERSSVSLAYLSEQGDAQYVFYKDTPHLTGRERIPAFGRDDLLLYGSYFAIAPGTRPLVEEVLRRAQAAEAIVYYDLNFRRSHQHELAALTPALRSNMRLSTLVRGSADDFEVMYRSRCATYIYKEYIAPLCPLFLMTAGSEPITLCTPAGAYTFEAPRVDHVVSSVGAGDNFNAGFLCALMEEGITRRDLPALGRDQWQRLIAKGTSYAAQVCQSTDNYITK